MGYFKSKKVPKILSRCKDSGNDFVRFSVPFLEGRISDIHAACNYMTN